MVLRKTLTTLRDIQKLPNSEIVNPELKPCSLNFPPRRKQPAGSNARNEATRRSNAFGTSRNVATVALLPGPPDRITEHGRRRAADHSERVNVHADGLGTVVVVAGRRRGRLGVAERTRRRTDA